MFLMFMEYNIIMSITYEQYLNELELYNQDIRVGKMQYEQLINEINELRKKPITMPPEYHTESYNNPFNSHNTRYETDPLPNWPSEKQPLSQQEFKKGFDRFDLIYQKERLKGILRDLNRTISKLKYMTEWSNKMRSTSMRQSYDVLYKEEYIMPKESTLGSCILQLDVPL